MSESKIHPTGAVLLLQEVFYAHTPDSARQLHGNDWKSWYNPERVLEPETILQNAQRSSLLIDTLVEIIDQTCFKKNKQILIARLYYRFGLYNGCVHSLEETGKKYGGITRERTRQALEKTTRKLRYTTSSYRLLQFLPENLRH